MPGFNERKSGNNHQRDEHDYELERIAARAIPFEVHLAPAISQAELEEQLRRMQAATVLGPSAVAGAAGAAGGWLVATPPRGVA